MANPDVGSMYVFDLFYRHSILISYIHTIQKYVVARASYHDHQGHREHGLIYVLQLWQRGQGPRLDALAAATEIAATE